MNVLINFVINIISYAFYTVIEMSTGYVLLLPDSVEPLFITFCVIVVFLLIYWLLRITIIFIQFVFNL